MEIHENGDKLIAVLKVVYAVLMVRPIDRFSRVNKWLALKITVSYALDRLNAEASSSRDYDAEEALLKRTIEESIDNSGCDIFAHTSEEAFIRSLVSSRTFSEVALAIGYVSPGLNEVAQLFNERLALMGKEKAQLQEVKPATRTRTAARKNEKPKDQQDN